MDDRKGTGRTADEIEPFFEALPDAGFCLDVAHAWSIDPTMAVAHEAARPFPLPTPSSASQLTQRRTPRPGCVR